MKEKNLFQKKYNQFVKVDLAKELIDQSLLTEVSNLVDKPRIIIAKFDKII